MCRLPAPKPLGLSIPLRNIQSPQYLQGLLSSGLPLHSVISHFPACTFASTILVSLVFPGFATHASISGLSPLAFLLSGMLIVSSRSFSKCHYVRKPFLYSLADAKTCKDLLKMYLLMATIFLGIICYLYFGKIKGKIKLFVL